MIAVLAAIVIVIIAGALIVREVRQLLYARQVRHMPILTELQARENAAPLSHAITHRIER